MSVDPKRFGRSGGVGIPQKSLEKYQVKQASRADTIEGAVPVTATPKTTQAHVAAAPHIAGAAQSEREKPWWKQAVEDPVLLVGVGVCAVCWFGSRFMRQ